MTDKALTLINGYLRWAEGINGIRKSSAKVYRIKIGKFFSWFGGNPDEAKEKDIGDFMIYLKEQKQGINSQRMFITALKGFYAWNAAKKKGKNPAKHLRALREFKKHPDILKVEEVEKMIIACGRDNFQQARNAAIIAVLADTGIRISELLALKVGNIQKNDDQFIMTVPATKASRNRMIPFCYIKEGDLVSEVFSFYWLQVKYYKEWGLEEPLFQRELIYWKRSRSGWMEGKVKNIEPGPLTIGSVAKMLKRVKTEAGVERNVTPHMFRHFYGTYLAVSGKNINVIQQRLGHASLDRTQIYIHYADVVKADSAKDNPMSGRKTDMKGPVKALREFEKRK